MANIQLHVGPWEVVIIDRGSSHSVKITFDDGKTTPPFRIECTDHDLESLIGVLTLIEPLTGLRRS